MRSTQHRPQRAAISNIWLRMLLIRRCSLAPPRLTRCTHTCSLARVQMQWKVEEERRPLLLFWTAAQLCTGCGSATRRLKQSRTTSAAGRAVGQSSGG